MGISKVPEYDVIIVGSGPAGISTAIHLTQLEPSIRNRLLVLEKETHPRKKICGGGIGAYTDYWLQRLGISLTIPSLELKRTRIAIDEDGYVEYCLDSGSFRTVRREEFDEALVRAALSLGISVVQNEPVTSFSRIDEAVVVQTRRRSLTTRVLVGADGVQSIIRKKICKNRAVEGPRNTCGTLCYMTNTAGLNLSDQKEEEAVIDFSCTFRRGIRGYAWSFPVITHGQKWLNTGVGGFSTSQKEGRLLKKIFEEFLAARGISLHEGRIEGWPIRWFHPDSIYSAERVLLVGDAAGIDPLWGEGIAFSLGYGHVAASAIGHALESRDFSFSTYKERLLRHEIGQELMQRLQWADKVYRSHNTSDVKDILLSLILPGRNR
jgi:geranylgeranyl reductase family protein